MGLVALVCAAAALLSAPAAPAQARTVMFCVTYEGSPVHLVKPRTCTVYFGGTNLEVTGQNTVGLRRLRWRGWGSPRATGRGRLSRDEGVAARLTLSRRRTCQDGSAAYTRARLTVRGNARTFRMPVPKFC
jgi:hypothetical protein